MIRYFLLVGILFFNLTNSFGQNIVLSGMVKDTTTAIPLPNANILAFPKNSDETTQFAISNEKGEYVLRLEKDVVYSIEVSYLGYQKLVFEHTATQDETKDLALVPKANDLEEVVLEYKIPIEVKEDTIT